MAYSSEIKQFRYFVLTKHRTLANKEICNRSRVQGLPFNIVEEHHGIFSMCTWRGNDC